MKKLASIALILTTTLACQQKPKTMGTSIKVGESITHELEGNITTGFNWKYTVENPDIVKITEEVSSENKEGIVGAPSKFKYKIEGAKAGNTKIFFKYFREWEKDVPPAQVDTVEVTVE
jgi:inhibitor of cysteine peptidase